MKDNFKISVIIPTYNRSEFILKAINSVKNQTFKVDEIIVVNDGSSDETIQILENIKDINVISTKNLGVSNARNIGIKNAKNNWITFLDSDDIWKEDKLEKQINFHKTNPDILFSYTNETWIYNNKEVNKGKSNKKYGGNIFDKIIKKCFIGASTTMINKKVFEDVGIFDTNLKVCEDYDLWLRIGKKYFIGYLEEELIFKIAGHENQLSFGDDILDVYRVKALLKHYHDNVLAKKELEKKLKVLHNGAKKRDNSEVLDFVDTISKEIFL
jgi:glycosyltransferase involved in cell wall biosynthesis